jgi:threonine dehydratase
VRSQPIRTLADWLADIEAARRRLAGLAVRTPLVQSGELSRIAGAQVLLKPEFIQPPGSFKVRGAANKMRLLGQSQKRRGVVTFSTGNHARAVAWVAAQLGIPATVCISERVPADKLAALRRLDTEVVVAGASQDDAAVVAHELARTRALEMVHPFDDPAVIAGQGTIGLELLEDCDDLASVLVPLSGGGLAGGVAAALKACGVGARVIGVSLARGGAMAASLRHGRPVEVPETNTIADSLSGGIGLDNAYTFDLVRDHVDDVVELDEDAVTEGVVAALRHERYVLEGAAAVGIAALVTGRVQVEGSMAIVLTGRQIALEALAALVAAHNGWRTDG